MSKQSVGPRPQSGGTPAAGSREERDLRLQRQLQLNQQAQLELSQAQTQLSYCGHFLKVVREQLQEMRSSCQLARSSQFAGWEGRIRQFTVAAIHHKMPPPEQPVRSQAVGTAKKGQCSQGAHLREVLQGAAVEREQEEIAQLEQKLELLYDRISTALKEQLLSDKILGRIKREARRAARSKLLPLVEREIGKYASWQRQNSSQLDREMGGRQVDEKIMGNLEQMKLVMGRKVATNDYIYEQFGEESGVHALIDRIGRLADSLTQQHQATNALIRQRYTLLQTTPPAPTLKAPTPKPLDLASVSAYFHAVQTTLGHLDADPHPALLQQSHRLSALLDSRLSALQPRR